MLFVYVKSDVSGLSVTATETGRADTERIGKDDSHSASLHYPQILSNN